jgi:hypothetical protein
MFRTLRVFGVDAEPSAKPAQSSLPSRPSSSSPAALAARVDDVESTATTTTTTTTTSTEEQWEVVEIYKDAEESDSTWTLKGRDQAGIDKAKSAIQEAIDKAKEATHVGFLTLPFQVHKLEVRGRKVKMSKWVRGFFPSSERDRH